MNKYAILISFALLGFGGQSASADSNTFTLLEQQQISVKTPDLFGKKNQFTINFDELEPNEWSFPLPVGKASLWPDYRMQITTKKGDNVKAIFDGVVRLSRKHPQYGNVIVIRHANGLETVYGNNAENLVKVGDKVKAGQTIAIVGTKDGYTYCQVEIMVDGRRVNPEIIFDIRSHRLRRQTLLFEKQSDKVELSVIHVEIDPQTGEALADNSKKWAFPLPGAKVISGYGGARHHKGVDLKTKPNDAIYAAFDGVVTRSSPYSGYGNCIIVKHNNGLETLYSHNSKNLVRVGDKVKAGQKIALTGRTGRATTEHLHFETIVNGRKVNPSTIFDLVKRVIREGIIKKYKL